MTRNPLNDSRRLNAAIHRLDALSAEHRYTSAKYVFDVCIYHVTRVRHLHPASIDTTHRHQITPIIPSPRFVFDNVYPHIHRIARRLDRAMRFAETTCHPLDAAALIVAVDAQGALAALFAVAQNAGIDPNHLQLLAFPLRKRSAPALLRTLFSPDMRVANAAKKALRQIIAIASCQNTPWISVIRSALSLRTATNANRSIQLNNLLSRLSDILLLLVSDANQVTDFPIPTRRKRSSRPSLSNLVSRPRHSLASNRRASEHQTNSKKHRFFFNYIFRKAAPKQKFALSTSDVSFDTNTTAKIRRRHTKSSENTSTPQISPACTSDDARSIASVLLSSEESCSLSAFSSVTESAATTLFSRSNLQPPHSASANSVKRDTATVMYIFERLLAKRINPELHHRIQVIDALANIAITTFSPTNPHPLNVTNPVEFRETMTSVFVRHGKKIYSTLLDILYRPAREVDANRIAIFSFRETGLMDVTSEPSLSRPKQADFPLNAVCLPNMDCTHKAASSCNTLLKIILRCIPSVCSHRMALLTGTVNSIFLNCSEALVRKKDACIWDARKLTNAVDSLVLLATLVPGSTEKALDVIVGEPVTLRLVLDTCLRSVSSSGRLLAQNAARSSAQKLSDEGTLLSLKSWRALLKVLPEKSSWTESASYSSSILFLAQVARRVASVSAAQSYTNEKDGTRVRAEDCAEVRNSLNSSISKLIYEYDDDKHVSDHEINQMCHSLSNVGIKFSCDEGDVLERQLHECIVAMAKVTASKIANVFFQLYRTIVYLYANDLKKQHKGGTNATIPEASSGLSGGSKSGAVTVASGNMMDDKSGPEVKIPEPLTSRASESRSRSEEGTKGVLVENIAVDGYLPSKSLRRAVMASELDLGHFFDAGQFQPHSLQYSSEESSGFMPNTHVFEEFAQAMAIILGALWDKNVMKEHESVQEIGVLIARDVQRSGSSYLKKVHKRAQMIIRRDVAESQVDWQSVKCEERIRRLEDQVASLTSLVQTSLEGSMQWSRKRLFPRVAGSSADGTIRPHHTDGQNEMHEMLCSPSKCFCVK